MFGCCSPAAAAAAAAAATAAVAGFCHFATAVFVFIATKHTLKCSDKWGKMRSRYTSLSTAAALPSVIVYQPYQIIGLDCLAASHDIYKANVYMIDLTL